MIFSQTIDNIDSEITALLAQVEAKKQRQTQLIELDALTDHTLEGLADVVSKIQCNAPDAIAQLKTAVLTLFDSGDDGSDGGNQPHSPTPDPDDSEFELLCLNGETGDYLTTDDLTDADIEADTSIKLTYTQAIKNRCSACWGYEVKSKADIKAGFINRTNLNFMEAVNLERTGREFYETVEGYLNKLYYNGQSCQMEDCPDSSRTGQSYEWASPLATPLTCLLWEDAPLLGQACAIETTPYVQLVTVTDAIAYQRKHDGEIVCCYIGFRIKSIATSWMRFIEAITDRVELRQALRMQGFKWEIKVKGMSIQQIERLSKEDIDKTYRPEIGSAKPPSYKPQPIAQPVNPDEVGEGDIVTALLTPSASYKIIQVMPNGILDCENLTSGDRLGLRPGAVSLVQKAEKSQEPEQQALDFEPKPDAPTEYARVKLKGDKFDGQLFAVVKGNELGSTLLTPNGHHWFRADCLEFIYPDSQTTTGNYKGLSKQIKQHWEKVGINPSDLIADMKAHRPPEPAWDAAKYNPVLAAVGAADDLDF